MNYIGIDVDSRLLVCASQRDNQSVEEATFTNDLVGLKKLIRWATRRKQSARICMEATGVYSLPAALALSEEARIEVMVANPKAIKNFSVALLQRGKTDRLDARTILQFCQKMPFRTWQPPAEEVLQLQYLSRRVRQLTTERTRETNRLKAAKRLGPLTRLVVNDIEVNVRHIEGRIKRTRQLMLELVRASSDLSPLYDLLISVVGISIRSALAILAELAVLPSDMTGRQWVAHAGLDPRPYESGTSIYKPSRITKKGNSHLRHALFYPGMVAVNHDPNVKAFYEKLTAAGKKPRQAYTAVMRKLLLAIWGIFKSQQPWDGQKFYQMT